MERVSLEIHTGATWVVLYREIKVDNDLQSLDNRTPPLKDNVVKADHQRTRYKGKSSKEPKGRKVWFRSAGADWLNSD